MIIMLICQSQWTIHFTPSLLCFVSQSISCWHFTWLVNVTVCLSIATGLSYLNCSFSLLCYMYFTGILKSANHMKCRRPSLYCSQMSLPLCQIFQLNLSNSFWILKGIWPYFHIWKMNRLKLQWWSYLGYQRSYFPLYTF
jgi:hypothetical protein